MKFILILFLIITLFQSNTFAQTNVKLIMTGSQSDEIIRSDMFDRNQHEIYEKTYSDTLTYHFTKSPKVEEFWIRYFTGDKMFRNTIWLDKGEVIVYVHLGKEELVIDSIINSSIDDDINNYYRELKHVPREKINSFKLEQIEKFINTPFSFDIGDSYLMNNSMSKQNLLPLKDVFKLQGKQFTNRNDYQNVVGKLNILLSIDQINLKNYFFTDRFNKIKQTQIPNAKYYLLDFWHLGCAPCREDHKKIKSNLNNFNNKGVEVIGISTDENIGDWQNYLSLNGYNWTNFNVPENNKILDDLKIGSYPSYFLIDSNFNFIGVFANIEHFQYNFLNKIE